MIPGHIAIHHSASPDGKTYQWEGIRAYHVNHNGWRDIGYHFGVELVDGHPHVHMGRMPNVDGAHVVGWNAVALGVCLVGNYSLGPPPAVLLEKAVALVRWLRAVYSIPVLNVRGHREFPAMATECPGTLFDMEAFRRAVR